MGAEAAGAAAVRVSVASLIGLAHAARGLSLHRGDVRARRSDVRRSLFKGRGMEYDESRLYQPGDDVRHLDWRVTARTGKPHTKLFREERERPVFLWVDCRAPMFFATRGRYKSVAAAQLAALLAWSAVHDGDRIGSVLFTEGTHREIKPQRGKTGALRLFRELAGVGGAAVGGDGAAHGGGAAFGSGGAAFGGAMPGGGGGNGGDGGNGGNGAVSSGGPAGALLRLSHIARPGSLIFFISDFRNFDERAETRLAQLAAHSETVLVFVCDALEERLPPPGHYRVGDGARDFHLDTGDAQFAADYAARFKRRAARLRALARKLGIGFLQCRTSDDPLAVLQRHFGTRAR